MCVWWHVIQNIDNSRAAKSYVCKTIQKHTLETKKTWGKNYSAASWLFDVMLDSMQRFSSCALACIAALYVCMCQFVSERERVREREREWERERGRGRDSVCVCVLCERAREKGGEEDVCVCVRERERERMCEIWCVNMLVSGCACACTWQHVLTHWFILNESCHSLSHLKCHFSKLFAKLKATARSSLMPHFSEERPMGLGSELCLELLKMSLQVR